MKEKDLKKFQNEILNIAKEFARICEKHNLKYAIEGGTLLGAIRHKGFIPWDDDLDVAMPREDYDKFCEIAKKELPENLFLQNMDTEENYGLIFSKLINTNTFACEEYSKDVNIRHSIWIDIFPYDNLPNDLNLAKKHFKKTKFFYSLLTIKLNYKANLNTIKLKIEYAIIRFITLFISKNFLRKKLNKLIRKYNNINCNNIIVYGCTYSFEQEIKEKSLFDNLVKYDFEDTKFYSFKDYDNYLKDLYGDYMTLPPVEKRKIHIVEFKINE